MRKVIDLYIVYEIVKRLATPFEKTPAYARGIIDKKGNVLRPLHTLKDPADQKAWTYFDILINNLKRQLAKVPGNTSVWAVAAAMMLLREPNDKVRAMHEQLQEDGSEPWLGLMEAHLAEAKELIDEDAPANAAGAGAIAGLGVGPQGEPGIIRRKKKRVEESFDHTKFAGSPVFDVDDQTFHACRMGKRKYAHYRKYVGLDETGQNIRAFGRKNPKAPIVLRNKAGQMLYLRYGKANS